jgi:hypothetical protein
VQPERCEFVVVVSCAGSLVEAGGGDEFTSASASTSASVSSCGELFCGMFVILETCFREIVGRVVDTWEVFWRY